MEETVEFQELESKPIPLPTVTLPSRGILYGESAPDGVVTVFPTGTKEDKLFASITRTSGEEIYNRIFSSCIQPAINPTELIAGDRTFLMLCIRAISHIYPYQFPTRCIMCGWQDKFEISIHKDLLTEERIKYLLEGFTEPFEVELPYSKTSVQCKHLRGTDLQAIASYGENRVKLGQDAEEAKYIYRFVKHIVSIEGKPKVSLSDKLSFVEGLKSIDTDALRMGINKNYCGVNTTLRPTCKRCGYIDEIRLPILPEFFRPTLRGVFGDS